MPKSRIASNPLEVAHSPLPPTAFTQELVRSRVAGVKEKEELKQADFLDWVDSPKDDVPGWPRQLLRSWRTRNETYTKTHTIMWVWCRVATGSNGGTNYKT